MSKHHHSSVVYEVTRLATEVRSATPEERESVHGIELLDNNSVYDLINGKVFSSLEEWSHAAVNEEMQSELLPHNCRQYFDDE